MAALTVADLTLMNMGARIDRIKEFMKELRNGGKYVRTES